MTVKSTSCLLLVFLLSFSLTGCLPGPAQNPAGTPEESMAMMVRSEIGGYEFVPLQGYEITEQEGSLSMFPAGGDPYSGPGMVMFNTAFDQAVDLEHVISLTNKLYPQYSFAEPEMMQVDGFETALLEYITEYHAIDGVVQEFYGAEEGETIRGRILLVARSPQLVFQCEMLSPDAQWKKLLPAFEDVIDSLRFFEPQG